MQPSEIHWKGELDRLKTELKSATKEQKDAIKKQIAEIEAIIGKTRFESNETPVSNDEPEN